MNTFNETEPTEYTCIDCDSGDLTYSQARWHGHHENHVIVELDDGDKEDQ